MLTGVPTSCGGKNGDISANLEAHGQASEVELTRLIRGVPTSVGRDKMV